MEESSDVSACPLCPDSIPPVPPSSTDNDATITTSTPLEASSSATDITTATASVDKHDDDILSWICCSKCSEWYHGICILQTNTETRETVPEVIRDYSMKQAVGNWTDWTKWVGRWFCHICIAHSMDSNNPHRPHHPLSATVDNKTFPPKPRIPRPRRSIKRSSSSVPFDGDVIVASPNVKKRKIDQNGTSTSSPLANGNHHAPSPASTSTLRNDSLVIKEEHADVPSPRVEPPDHIPDPTTVDSPAMETVVKDEFGVARPKREAAKNRPDYHALHHHIATPTARWLDLIRDPAKHNTEIKDGNFPRVPASLLTKEWLESEEPPAGSSRSHTPLDLPAPPSDPAGPSRSTPTFSPSLYYGPLREPLIITPEDGGFEGLGGKIPGRDLTVSDVARLVGPERTVDVIDIATQQSTAWTLAKWAEYVSQRFGQTSLPDTGPLSKVYNVISLEITGTALGNKVKPPRIVSEIDWVDNCWDFGPGGKEAALQEEARCNGGGTVQSNGNGQANGTPNGIKKEKTKAREPWPKVQLYCLMGAKGSWTDWHCDFAASSVYYTIHTGAKTFFFIRPTAKNLAAYAQWSGSYEKQQTVWLGDMCDEVRKVTLKQGDTMMIPAGYIHSVYTPEDSIVFGGNFLHSYDIPTQLRLRQIEIDTKVPQRFRYPNFDKLCWYVANHYCSQLRSTRSYTPKPTANTEPLPCRRVLDGLLALSTFLIEQCDRMENPEVEDRLRKLVYGRIPDLVKDAPALARELKWRVQRELPSDSTSVKEEYVDTEEQDKPPAKAEQKPAVKRKLFGHPPQKGRSRTWNFEPPAWKVTESAPEESIQVGGAPRPRGAPEDPTPTRREKATQTVVKRETNKVRMYPMPNQGWRQDLECWTVVTTSMEWEGLPVPVEKEVVEQEVPGEDVCVD